MNFHNNGKYSPEEELASLPGDYTRKMAINNNDVLYDYNRNYNTDKFFRFLNNVNNGIPDKIRITSFGIDGPAAIRILQYDGYIIRSITDVTRYIPNQYYDDYGYQIISQIRKSLSGAVLEDYFLITIDNKPVTIFSVYLQQ
ncbi:MAG: hypothetical protein K0S76_254 [Herbinix sp.]|jgi:hypothetical protein|nr:hypothetical protein [Herbinix sp.]